MNITPASEVMAILCLAKDYQDLGERLGRMVVGFTYKGTPVRAKDIQAEGAMQILLRDAVHPNLVQTLEGTPAFVHAGPFANIAQGTNTAIATRLALKLADYVVTEAGFATDLGAEKFCHIKCRSAGLTPRAAVIVATCRAVAYHGGYTCEGGLGNLGKHIENIRAFGLEPVVAINHFADDEPGDVKKIVEFCAKEGVEAVVADHYAEGGKGAKCLAEAVLRIVGKSNGRKLKYLYELEDSLPVKINKVARTLYGAEDVVFDRRALGDLKMLEANGFGKLPICIAKTSASLSDNAGLRGRPKGFKVTVNELRISAGAGFVVVICGDILTMPGLPKVPAAARMKVLADGQAVGLS
jgi:formate--tetrahydrofolate ligase